MDEKCMDKEEELMRIERSLKSKSGSKEARGGASPTRLIDAKIAALGDWRGETLARVRAIIKQADPDVVEEVKCTSVRAIACPVLLVEVASDQRCCQVLKVR
jgi:hypothetical protein